MQTNYSTATLVPNDRLEGKSRILSVVLSFLKKSVQIFQILNYFTFFLLLWQEH